MADRLTAGDLTQLARVNPRFSVVYTVTIDNDAITATDITRRVRKFGSLKTAVFNKHPEEQGEFELPVVTLTADNGDGYFDYQSTIFPKGRSDLASTSVRIEITITPNGQPARDVLDYTGRLREPEHTNEGDIRLVVEHPLTAASERKWRKEDRIGGKTGYSGFFA